MAKLSLAGMGVGLGLALVLRAFHATLFGP